MWRSVLGTRTLRQLVSCDGPIWTSPAGSGRVEVRIGRRGSSRSRPGRPSRATRSSPCANSRDHRVFFSFFLLFFSLFFPLFFRLLFPFFFSLFLSPFLFVFFLFSFFVPCSFPIFFSPFFPPLFSRAQVDASARELGSRQRFELERVLRESRLKHEEELATERVEEPASR